MTTFGELTTLAARHLDAANRGGAEGLTGAESVAALAALSNCLSSCQLLWRTVDRPDRRFCDPDPAWQRAGGQLDRALTDAIRHLQRATPTAARDLQTATATHLHAASVAIGASHDLLATHSDTLSTGRLDRTGFAAVIDSPAGRRALAEVIVAHLRRLTSAAELVGGNTQAQRPTRETALRASDALHEAQRAIRTAGVLVRPERELLPAVPLLSPLQLSPVRNEEPPQVLLREAIRGAERLHRVAREEIQTGHLARYTPGSIATVAVAMSTAQLATAQAFRKLQTPATNLVDGSAGTRLDAHLQQVADTAEQAGHAWAEVRTRWQGIRAAREDGPADAIRREATDLTTRIGRLVHTDPVWLPRLDANKELRPGTELAPDPATLWNLLGGLRQLSALTADIAVDHGDLTHALHSRDLLLVRTSTLPAEYDIARRWASAPRPVVQKLASAQHHATATTRLSWTTAVALTELAPREHRDPARVTLETRRLAPTANSGRYR